MTTRSVLAAVLLTGAVSASRCGGEKAPAGRRRSEIGFFGALTGPQATFALSGKNGARLAVDQINRAGGVLGKRLDLLVEDDHNEPSEAASAVSKLITRDHVVALIGENASSRSLAAAPIAQSYRVPMVSPSSTNVEVTKKGDYIFRVCFVDSYQGKALADFRPPEPQSGDGGASRGLQERLQRRARRGLPPAIHGRGRARGRGAEIHARATATSRPS